VSILAYLYQKYGRYGVHPRHAQRAEARGDRPDRLGRALLLKLAIWGEGSAVLAADSINWVAILIFVAALAAMRK
jgi:hypothetical protein